ncbi:MAG TPA: outer membrane beta-barrel protein [Candidatus Binatia bacterium]|nr:outer membrane beta-barrel protein [Candidatus Binatia bacterium]
MPASQISARGYPPGFSRKEQPVALRGSSQARLLKQSRRARLATQSALAPLGDFFVRVRPVLSLFAASLIAFAPLHAAAQDEDQSVSVRERPRPEYDPRGTRLGAFMLHGSLDGAITMTDNLFADPAVEEEDTIYTLGAHARLNSNWSRHALGADAGYVSVTHDEFSSEDHETSYAGLRGRLDIGRSTNIGLVARVSHEIEARSDPDAGGVGTPLTEFDRTYFNVSAQHSFNRVRFGVAAWQSENDYDDLQNFRDFEGTGASARVDVAVTPRIGLFGQASADERDYNNDPTLSSDGTTYLVGASIDFTDLMEGEIAVGHFEREYADGGSSDGLAVFGNLQWYITRLTTISVNASRNSEDVIGRSAEPYVLTRFGARVDHELLRNVILTAGAGFANRDFLADDREDDHINYDVGVDWFLNPRVALEGRIVHEEIDSNAPAIDYDENRATLGISLRL